MSHVPGSGDEDDDATTPGTAGRALNIHTFVKFDGFLMNLSPNSIRDRGNPYLIIVKFN